MQKRIGSIMNMWRLFSLFVVYLIVDHLAFELDPVSFELGQGFVDFV